jgi:hypothetical protein
LAGMNLFQFFTYQWSPESLLTEVRFRVTIYYTNRIIFNKIYVTFYLKSRAIANAAYFTSLKQVGRQEKSNKILYFLIMRAQKPIQLTAGGYIKLSMETFGIVYNSKTYVKNIFRL